MKGIVKQTVVVFGLALGLMAHLGKLDALVCDSPFQPAGTTWCDADPTRFTGDTLCVAEPIGRDLQNPADLSTVTQEMTGAGVCVLGKIRPDQLDELVDFTVIADFQPTLGLVEDILDQVFAPEFDQIFASDVEMSPTGEFMTTLPLAEEGIYNVLVKGRFVTEGGAGTGPFLDVGVTKEVVRVSLPNFQVIAARRTGEEPVVDSDGDGICDFYAVCNDLFECGGSQTALPHPNRGLICQDGPDPTADPALQPAQEGFNVGSPEPEAPYSVRLAPQDSAGIRARTMDLCLAPGGGENLAGQEIRVHLSNRITDNSVSPPREIEFRRDCGDESSFCSVAPSGYCGGGYLLTIPLAHGTNEITLEVENALTGYGDLSSGQTIALEPFFNDLRGPSLEVKYLDDSGRALEDVDNNVLLAERADQVMIDLTLGEAVAADQDATPCDPENPTPSSEADGSASIQRQNETEFVKMCPIEEEGEIHYRARFSNPRFPINTLTVRAIDNLGNQTLETHSFGYGGVRPLFREVEDEWQFDLQGAMIPKALGGFIPTRWMRGELKDLILKAVNSEKFKNEAFPKLLDPRVPVDEEITCLEGLEGTLGSSFDHLASKERVVAIKLFCPDGECDIGNIEIPENCRQPDGSTGLCLWLMNDNRIRLQLKIHGLHGDAEMYTIEFRDSDDDNVMDTEDDDADNDGLCDREIPHIGSCTDANEDRVCDEEVGISGSRGRGLNSSRKCVLDKTIAREDCPDVEAGDLHYWGCQDLDDDTPKNNPSLGDGIPDDRDLPGRLVEDPDYGTYVLPLKFAVRELALTMEIQLEKGEDGLLDVKISPAPVNDRAERIVVAIPDDKYLIEFDCDRQRSMLFQGGRADEQGNGRNLWIDTEACRALESLNSALSGNEDPATDFLIGQGKTLGLIDPVARANQATNDQFRYTFEATLRCSTPKRAEAALAKFESEKLSALSVKLLDKRFHLDLYAPLASADLGIDSRGINFAGGGLLIPAGVTDENDTAERNAADFLNSLPPRFKNERFGPLYNPDENPADPVVAALEMGSELNLAIKEETINSALHSVGLLLWDLARQEGDAEQSLDLDTGRVKELGLGIPQNGRDGCLDEEGREVREVDAEGNIVRDSFQCFPFALEVGELFGGDFNYVDFDGDGVPGTVEDNKSPVLLRSAFNPDSPPTVRIVSVTPIEAWGGQGPTRPAVMMAELEIGMGAAPMTVFEEQRETTAAGVVQCRLNPGTERCLIKDWCDPDRFPGMNRARCQEGRKLPMVVFETAGRLFVTALISIRNDGLISAEAGLSSLEVGGTLTLDTVKSYFNISVAENNSVVPDKDLITTFQANINTILGKYLFGTDRDIRFKIPARLPLEAFCNAYKEDLCEEVHAITGEPAEPLCKVCQCVDGERTGEDCDPVQDFQDLWEGVGLDDFGIEGLTLVDPLLGVTGGDLGETRYLTIGAGVDFDLSE